MDEMVDIWCYIKGRQQNQIINLFVHRVVKEIIEVFKKQDQYADDAKNLIDYMTAPLNISVFPGRGTDDNENFKDWDINDIRERVRLVQEFDMLADKIVDYAIMCANNYIVEDEEIFIPKTRKILVPLT